MGTREGDAAKVAAEEARASKSTTIRPSRLAEARQELDASENSNTNVRSYYFSPRILLTRAGRGTQRAPSYLRQQSSCMALGV